MGASDNNAGYSYDDSQDYYFHSGNISGKDYDYDKCHVNTDSSAGQLAVHYIALVVFPVLLLQGIVGNLLAIPVLISVSRNAWSTVIYLACLAGTDLAILLIRCGETWYTEAVGYSVSEKIMSSSDAACKAYYFSFMCVQHINPWLVVAASVDTMIATRWPRRTYNMCTLERARCVLLLMGILVVCLDINYFWTFGVPKPGFPCMYIEEFSDLFKDDILPALNNAVGTFLPLAAVSACFTVTALTLHRSSSAQLKEQESEMKKYFLELATLKDFKTICLILCLIFICLGVFKTCYVIATALNALGYVSVGCVTRQLFDTMDMTFAFLFYGAKIYLYVAFSSMFREKLKLWFFKTIRKSEFFCKKICRCDQNWALVPPRDKCHEIGNDFNEKRHSEDSDDNKTSGEISLYHSGRTKSADQIPRNNTASYDSTCGYVETNGLCSKNWNQRVSGNTHDLRTWEDVQMAGSGTNV